MSSIFDEIRGQLGPDTIQQLSQAVGADPNATSTAISAALPALLGQLSQNVAEPQGAAALDNALNAHDGSILDNLGGLLGGGGGMNNLGGIGGKILGHILGSKRAPVEQGVGQASGLDAAQVAQLMAMLAPIIMGVLGRMKRQKGIDANALPNVLNQPGGGGLNIPSLGSIFGQK